MNLAVLSGVNKRQFKLLPQFTMRCLSRMPKVFKIFHALSHENENMKNKTFLWRAVSLRVGRSYKTVQYIMMIDTVSQHYARTRQLHNPISGTKILTIKIMQNTVSLLVKKCLWLLNVLSSSSTGRYQSSFCTWIISRWHKMCMRFTTIKNSFMTI